VICETGEAQGEGEEEDEPQEQVMNQARVFHEGYYSMGEGRGNRSNYRLSRFLKKGRISHPEKISTSNLTPNGSLDPHLRNFTDNLLIRNPGQLE
jgi:hypothetical protein